MTSAPLLVIEHESQCPPGWMAEWLLDAGAELDVRRPYRGDPLPENLSGHAGMLVLGGEMGADEDDRYPWLTEVKRLIAGAATTASPVLGICLGHQLAAVALGGEVQRNPLGQQIGVFGVGWTESAADDPLLGSLAARGSTSDVVPAVQWNNDIVVRLPQGAVDLAHTSGGELQAARFAPTVWGVQWHPEAGEEIIRPWADHDRDAAFERGVDVYAYLDDVFAARDRLRATWCELADRFAELCEAPRRVEARP